MPDLTIKEPFVYSGANSPAVGQFQSELNFKQLRTIMLTNTVDRQYQFWFDKSKAVPGSEVSARLVANGNPLHAPILLNIRQLSNSNGWDNRTGVINLLRFYFDGDEASVTISQPATTAPIGTPSKQIKVINSIYPELSQQDPGLGFISAQSYWPGNRGVGGFFNWNENSTLPVDHGLVFEGQGNPAVGRWIRESDALVSINDYGAVSGGLAFNKDLTFAQLQVPQLLLSDVFSTLASAQSWFPAAGVISLAESLNSAAIQQAHAKSFKIVIPAGNYWLNKTIEYYSRRSIVGAGVEITFLLFAASAQAGFKPLAFQAPDSTGNEIYKKSLTISDFSCVGSATKVDYATGVPTTLATYNQSHSGFYSPPRQLDGNGVPLPNEANLGFPLIFESRFENLSFSRFAGSGFCILNQFSCAPFSSITGDENSGYGAEIQQNVGTLITNTVMQRFNQKGGWYLPGGCSMVNCNGIDTFAIDLPWGVVGVPGSPGAVVANFVGCNFEGAQQALYIYGDASKVTFDSCLMQWYCADVTRPFIRCYGSGGTLIFKGSLTAFSTSGSPQVRPNNLIMVMGNAWGVSSENLIKDGSTFLTWVNVDASGNAGAFGYGNQIFPAERGTYPGNGAGAAIYGEYVRQLPLISTTKVYLGRSIEGVQPMAAIGTVDTMAALPTVAATPGLYLNANVGATAANLLFKKTGTGTGGWTAI